VSLTIRHAADASLSARCVFTVSRWRC
jgi:hypothetical protein